MIAVLVLVLVIDSCDELILTPIMADNKQI